MLAADTPFPAHLNACSWGQCSHQAVYFLRLLKLLPQDRRIPGLWSERAVFTKPRTMDSMDGVSSTVWPRGGLYCENRTVCHCVCLFFRLPISWLVEANSRSLWLLVNALCFGYGTISPCVPTSRDTGMQPPHNGANSRTSLTAMKLSPNMDIHFRASNIPV